MGSQIKLPTYLTFDDFKHIKQLLPTIQTPTYSKEGEEEIKNTKIEDVKIKIVYPESILNHLFV